MNLTSTTKEQFAARLKDISHETLTINKRISELPEGSASIQKNGDYRTIRGSLKGEKHIFVKGEEPLAAKLMYRKYLTCRLQDLADEKKTIEYCLRHLPFDNGRAMKYLITNPERANMIRQFFTAQQDHTKYRVINDPSLAPLQEKRTEPTPAGISVRSKSEVIIVTVLIEHGLVFIYEQPLYIGGKTFYPDFTIIDPVSGSPVYYEHFGMMDDPYYSRKASEKITFYTQHGIVPGVNLIMTFETRDHPLTITRINNALDVII